MIGPPPVQNVQTLQYNLPNLLVCAFSVNILLISYEIILLIITLIILIIIILIILLLIIIII